MLKDDLVFAMFNITPFLVLINHLLDEYEYESGLYKLRKPIKLIVSPQAYDRAKKEFRGIECRSYNQVCNEHYFEGRAILLCHGVDRPRCLSGVITKFTVVPMNKPPVRNKRLNREDRHYDEDTLRAEIEYEIGDPNEYRMIKGVLLPLSDLPN